MEQERTVMKKFLSMLLAVCLLMSVFTFSAAAECNYSAKVDKMVEKLEKKAEKAEEKIRQLQIQTLYRMVDNANRRVEQLVRVAQKTPYDDIDWLQASVAAVVAPVFAYADMIGAKVQCTYTTYYIDGRYVDVDPLRVINVI